MLKEHTALRDKNGDVISKLSSGILSQTGARLEKGTTAWHGLSPSRVFVCFVSMSRVVFYEALVTFRVRTFYTSSAFSVPFLSSDTVSASSYVLRFASCGRIMPPVY